MKSRLLPSILIVLLLSSTAFPQLPFKLGVRAGLNIGNLSFDPDVPTGVDLKSRTGFKFGAFAELGFIKIFAIQVEPMYVQKGGIISFQSEESTTKLSYIEIPVLLKLKFPTPGPVTPYVFAGPNIGILLSASSSNGVDVDIKDEINSTDFALDFGAGVGFNIAPLIDLIIDGRYSLGLSDTLNDTGKQDIGNYKVKTKGIQIVVGLMFGL